MLCHEESSSNSLELFYPRFEAVSPPHGSNAARAWKGTLTPFSDCFELGKIAEDLRRGLIIHLDVDGVLRHNGKCSIDHTRPAYLARLIKMRVEFEVLVLEFEDGRHRQSFCLKPEISSSLFPTHPHLRRDQTIFLTRPIDALCPYRSDETQPDSLTTYLDYVSIFLAKHLIWVRTFELHRYSGGAAWQPVFVPEPNGGHFTPSNTAVRTLGPAPWLRTSRDPVEIFSEAASRKETLQWEGNWLGPSAPHDPAVILDTVDRDAKCVCGRERRYGACCRPLHKRAVSEGQSVSSLVLDSRAEAAEHIRPLQPS